MLTLMLRLTATVGPATSSPEALKLHEGFYGSVCSAGQVDHGLQVLQRGRLMRKISDIGGLAQQLFSSHVVPEISREGFFTKSCCQFQLLLHLRDIHHPHRPSTASTSPTSSTSSTQFFYRLHPHNIHYLHHHLHHLQHRQSRACTSSTAPTTSTSPTSLLKVTRTKPVQCHLLKSRLAGDRRLFAPLQTPTMYLHRCCCTEVVTQALLHRSCYTGVVTQELACR